MIAYLKGTLISQHKEKVILDVSGVGYEVLTPSNYSFHTGDSFELWIYTHVREDSFQLYGFLETEEKKLFITLIGINGVGPKVALGILSTVSYQQLIEWIESENITELCQLPKIGKKTASQIILSLKGKLISKEVTSENTKHIQTKNEVHYALTRLGFRSTEVKSILDKVDMSQGTKQGIQNALLALQK